MEAEDLNIGRIVATRYRLDGLLGRGGFGSVYRGWDTQIGRDVAVKLLDVADGSRSTSQTTELRERFRREAMAAGRINHRGIVTVYDFGIPDDGGEAFLVMELLAGHDLAAELAERGPISPDRAQKLFVPMLEGLGKGHELGIIHKDIKPPNVFLSSPGERDEAFCLVDFGVARVVHEDKLTLTGLIVGTPQYMAPEYIMDTLVTPALDVYQMGLLLVEAITGCPAVPDGENFVRTCNRHFTGDLDIPEELFEGDFGEMLKLVLEPNPSKRLADATEFARLFSEIDPSTIVLDSQSTMVFTRRETDVDAKPTLYPPMQPAEASAELERIEQSSGQLVQPHTPTATVQPQTSPLPRPVARIQPVSSPTTTVSQDPVDDANSTLMAIGIVLFLGVAIVSVALGLAVEQQQPTLPPPRAPSPTISAAGQPPTEVPAEIAEFAPIGSEPTGALVVVDGVEVGRTPLNVEVGHTAEVRFDGYETAVVEIEAGMAPVRLRKLPELPEPEPPAERPVPAARAHDAPPSQFPGRVFDPEEPDLGEPDTVAPPPAKFRPPNKNAVKQRWDKPLEDED